MEIKGKLYDIVRRVELPFHASYDPAIKGYRSIIKTLPATFAMHWPDGTPCIYIEMYLLDIARTLTVREQTGGSLKPIVSHLSPLIRHCWRIKKNFWDLYDDDFKDFGERLQAERKPNNPTLRQRNNNTVREIMDTSINFLRWFQKNLVPGRIIVGTREQDPQIVLVEMTYTDYRGHRKKKLVFPYRPAPATREPKGPMPSIIRNKLWEAIATSADPARFSQRYRARFADERDFLAERDAIRERQELELELFEAIGCRPGELSALSASLNANCADSRKLDITTLKRRKGIDPRRKVPLDLGVAIKLWRYIEKSRKQMLTRLREKGIKVDPQDRVFLCSKKGTPLSAETMEREFARLVKTAGVEQRACISMFRHRFISNMVKLHLMAFLEENPEIGTRVLMKDSDYRTILRRVIVYTGHASEDSLKHYMDLAWDEIGVFNYVQPACDLVAAVEGSFGTLTSLMAEIKLKPYLSSQQIIERVTDELKALRNRAQDAMYAAKKYKKIFR